MNLSNLNTFSQQQILYFTVKRIRIDASFQHTHELRRYFRMHFRFLLSWRWCYRALQSRRPLYMPVQMVFIPAENSTKISTHFDCDATAEIHIRPFAYTVHYWEFHDRMIVWFNSLRDNLIIHQSIDFYNYFRSLRPFYHIIWLCVR